MACAEGNTCCRRLSGKQIKANLKRIRPTGDAIGDRGRDGSTFTSVRVGDGSVLYGSKSLQVGSKFAPCGAGWVGSELARIIG